MPNWPSPRPDKCNQCANSIEQPQYWQNNALIQNYYANYVLAKANLDKAQTAYDDTHVGQYINNANEAAAYNALYTAQQAYNTAQYYYSLYSQAPTQNHRIRPRRIWIWPMPL